LSSDNRVLAADSYRRGKRSSDRAMATSPMQPASAVGRRQASNSRSRPHSSFPCSRSLSGRTAGFKVLRTFLCADTLRPTWTSAAGGRQLELPTPSRTPLAEIVPPESRHRRL